MSSALKAVYRNGMFILQTSCNLPEGAEVELWVQSPQVVPPTIVNPIAKQEFLKALVERMQQNPIPLQAPQMTRDRHRIT
jgi:predicted DNA-binding antitoxin AbrB/MazE fold protein